MPGIVLDENAEETLHRTADSAVHHDRLLLLRIGADVESAETLRQVEVDLRRAALPLPADGIAQHILELRTVERAFAWIDACFDAVAGLRGDLREDARQHIFGVIPHG